MQTFRSMRTGFKSEVRGKLCGAARRVQVLKTAGKEFAATGMHATTTRALAHAAGVTEPVLYEHFGSKETLFHAAVSENLQARISELSARFISIPALSLAECMERMAEATVTVCLSEPSNALLTEWALLEDPDYAVARHRREHEAIRTLWDREIAGRFPASRVSDIAVSYAVTACLALGFWLASLRQTGEEAGPSVRLHAAGIARTAATLLDV